MTEQSKLDEILEEVRCAGELYIDNRLIQCADLIEVEMQRRIADDYKCPFCGSNNTTRSEETETFDYGDGNTFPVIKVTANVLVDGCIDCGQQWTNGDQEQARSDAIINALAEKLKAVAPPQARRRNKS